MKFVSVLILLVLAFISACQEKSKNITCVNLKGNICHIDSSLTVLYFLNTECPICQKYLGTFKQMNHPKAQVYYVFSGVQNKEAIHEMCAYDSISNAAVLLDEKYLLAKAFKAEITPEVIILKHMKTVYKGMIDDRFLSIGTSKSKSSVNYVENALISLNKNEAVKIPYTKAVGCFIEPH